MTADIGHGTSWGTSQESGREISRAVGQDSGRGGLGRGMGFGRGGGLDSLAERREAAQRRLSSSARAAELVECALRRFDEALTDQGVPDGDASLRATVRAALSLAYGTVDYDVTLLPAATDLAVRVRNTPFGPEAEVVDLTAAVDPAAVNPLSAPARAPVEVPVEALAESRVDPRVDAGVEAPAPWSPWTDASALR